MKLSVRRMLAASTATAVAAVGALALTAPVAAGTTTAAAQAPHVAAKKAAKKKKKKKPVYGMAARAFGTQVNAKALGVQSDRTAFSQVACTTGNRNDREALVGAAVPDTKFLDVGVVRTHTQSRKGKKTQKIGFPKGTKAATRATSKVADVKLAGLGPLNLKLEGLTSEARAWVNKKGKFKTAQKHKVVNLSAHTGIGPLDDLLNNSDSPLKALVDVLTGKVLKDVLADQIIDGVLKVAGLGEFKLSKSTERVNKRRAISQATVLDVRLYGADGKPGGQGPSAGDIRVRVGLARAKVMKGLEKGRFGGNATALHANVLGGVLNTAKIAYQPIPCLGTNGKTQKQAVGGIDLLGLGQIKADTIYTTIKTKSGKKKAGKAVSHAETARVVIGGNNGLVINAISARAAAKRNKIGKLKRAVKVNLGDIYLGGNQIDLDQLLHPVVGGVDELLKGLGIARVKTRVVSKTGSGVRVIALQVQLLDGKLADIKVGDVNAKVFKKARK